MREKTIEGLQTLEKRHRGYPIPVLAQLPQFHV
jgi:hypothetical protein